MLFSFITIQPLIPDLLWWLLSSWCSIDRFSEHISSPPFTTTLTHHNRFEKEKKKKRMRFRWKQVGQKHMYIPFFLHLICHHEHFYVITHQCPPNHLYCCCSVSRSCPALWPTDYSPPGSSVHGVSQARILEWVSIYISHHIYNAAIFHCMSEYKYNWNIVYAIHWLNNFFLHL